MDLDWLQWPAMVVTIAAAWLVASNAQRRRAIGFWCFLTSNVLWIAWGIATTTWALVVLQLFLAVTNIRGAAKTRDDAETAAAR